MPHRCVLWLLVVVGTSWTAPCVAAAGDAPPVTAARSVPVAVFPAPGSRYNRPATQIAFRGVRPQAIGRVTVSGSRTGRHRGRLAPDADGDGASFLPSTPFAANETVTVSTRLRVLGVPGGRFTFAIGNVEPLIPAGTLSDIPRVMPHGLMRFHSRPDLQPAALTIDGDTAPTSEGYLFLAPQNGPVQDGPMILDARGQLVWFSPLPVSKNVFANDFRVQDLYGQPVLTWWQGFRNTGIGQSRGVGVIVNRSYHQIATVRAVNGLGAGSHEFLVTPEGDAYITASSPVRLPGRHGTTIDSVVQEIDIRTGLLLFEWHALDHVPLSDAYSAPALVSGVFDPYHVNSVSLDHDGNLLVSLRNTSAVYKVDHRSGRVLWILGGKHSSFRMGKGTSTYLQHDAVVQSDGTLTVFDNGGYPPFAHPFSRGIREQLDLRTMTTTLVGEYRHRSPLNAPVEGGMQMLPDGDAVIGWGVQPFFSEDDAAGNEILNGRFNERIASYRAYRFVWNAQPSTLPALALSATSPDTRQLYASWNGATDVASWRVLGGTSPAALAPVATAAQAGFETAISVTSRARYFAVQAVGADGRVLARSQVVTVRGGH